MRMRAGILPSRNFVLVVGSLLIAVVLVVFAYNISQKKISGQIEKKDIVVVQKATPNQPASFEVSDSDGDGLLDWEEILREMDPNNPDTDGDGITDGEEVAQGQNTKNASAENGSVPTHTGVNKQVTLSQTDAFARDLFGQFSALQLLGGAPASGELNGFVQSLSAQALQGIRPSRQYTIQSINTIPTTDESVRSYINALGFIVKIHPIDINVEIETLQKALATEDSSKLKRLAFVSSEYQNVVANMLTLSVPDELASNHIAVINSLLVLSESFLQLQNASIDPVTALGGLNSIGSVFPNIQAGILKIQSILLERNIEFSPSEGGYLFQKGIS